MKLKLSFLMLSLVTTMTYAQQLDLPTIQQLDAIFLRDIPEDAPGAAVAVLSNGTTVYERYGGFANLKKKTVIDEDTRFNIASNGKQFTALAILLLEEEEKISLDDDIRKYLPSLFKDIADSITIRHLLTHTSGIRDVYDLWSLKGMTWWKEKLANVDAIQLLERQEELNFRPGSSYLYSNSNYILLAEIVSSAARKDFVDFTDEMFGKLGMHGTSFVSDYKKIPPPVGEPYFNFNEWFNYNWTCNIHGDGNLFSSMKDQVTWEKLIQSGESDLLSKQLLDKSQNLISSAQDYGYGLEYGMYKGKDYRFHEGATGAWKATLLRFVNPELTIVTLTNSGKIGPSRQSRNMADVLLDLEVEEQNRQIAPKSIGDTVALSQITGSYQLGTDVFQFEEKAGALFLLRYGRNDTELIRESANVFHQWNDPTFKQEFVVNDDGSVNATFYHTSHQPYTITKAAADWSNFDLNSINGRYVNSELDVEFSLEYDTDKQYVISFGKKERKGVLLTPEKLFVDGYLLKIGSSNALLLDGNRIRNVRFIKR